MTNNAIKQAVIDKLADDLKIYLDRSMSFTDLVPYVERAFGRRIQRKQTSTVFFQLYLQGIKPHAQTQERTFRPWVPKPHPRRAEIEAGQPPMAKGVMSIGNGPEYSKVWTR